MLLYITKNINPSYNVIPCFVRKNPKTTLKICVISKQSLWFSIANTSNFSYYFPKKQTMFPFLLFLLFFRTLPFKTIPSHIKMIQSNKNSKFKLTKFPN